MLKTSQARQGFSYSELSFFNCLCFKTLVTFGVSGWICNEGCTVVWVVITAWCHTKPGG